MTLSFLWLPKACGLDTKNAVTLSFERHKCIIFIASETSAQAKKILNAVASATGLVIAGVQMLTLDGCMTNGTAPLLLDQEHLKIMLRAFIVIHFHGLSLDDEQQKALCFAVAGQGGTIQIELVSCNLEGNGDRLLGCESLQLKLVDMVKYPSINTMKLAIEGGRLQSLSIKNLVLERQDQLGGLVSAARNMKWGIRNKEPSNKWMARLLVVENISLSLTLSMLTMQASQRCAPSIHCLCKLLTFIHF